MDFWGTDSRLRDVYWYYNSDSSGAVSNLGFEKSVDWLIECIDYGAFTKISVFVVLIIVKKLFNGVFCMHFRQSLFG